MHQRRARVQPGVFRPLRRTHTPYSAFTLTELLVVVTIVVVLLAATLPIAKRIMNDSRSRDSARILAGNFAMAKTYAARNNRPYGVWLQLEQPIGLSNTLRLCRHVYLAEVQPPYAGDTLGSSGAYVEIPTLGSPGPPDFRGPWELLFSASSATMLPSLVGQGEVFRIRFDYHGHQYLGYRDTSTPTARYYVYGLAGPDGQWGVANTDDDGNSTTDDASEHMAGGSDDLQIPIPPHLIQNSGLTAVPHPFQILRLPRRVGNPIELPVGTCLDMEYCGMGATGGEFAATIDHLIVMFSPKGEIDGLLADNDLSGATGTLHFLVGQVEKLNVPGGTDPDHATNMIMFNPAKSNLSDVNSVWVSIGRLSGQVVTSENLVPPIDEATLSPTTVNIFPGEAAVPTGRRQVLNPTVFADRATYVQHCREAATARDQMGGK